MKLLVDSRVKIYYTTKTSVKSNIFPSNVKGADAMERYKIYDTEKPLPRFCTSWRYLCVVK